MLPPIIAFCNSLPMNLSHRRQVLVLLSLLCICIPTVYPVSPKQHARMTVSPSRSRESIGSRPRMPQFQPSRAAASLQQDMDKETSVGVCAQVSLPYYLESTNRTNIYILHCRRCQAIRQQTSCLRPPTRGQAPDQHRVAGIDTAWSDATCSSIGPSSACQTVSTNRSTALQRLLTLINLPMQALLCGMGFLMSTATGSHAYVWSNKAQSNIDVWLK